MATGRGRALLASRGWAGQTPPRGTVASHFPGHVILAVSLSSLYIYTLSPPLLFLLSSILSFISPLLYPLFIPYSSLPLSIVIILFSLT